jgi:hypothetical protein
MQRKRIFKNGKTKKKKKKKKNLSREAKHKAFHSSKLQKNQTMNHLMMMERLLLIISQSYKNKKRQRVQYMKRMCINLHQNREVKYLELVL